MTSTAGDTAPPPRPTRRALARGTFWAVPTAVVAVSAPAFASSTPVTPPDHGDSTIGLQGLLNVGKGCSGYGGGPYDLVVNAQDLSSTKPVYDENGVLVKYGFYVLGATASQRPANARFTIYLPSALGSIAWTNRATTSGWTNLMKDSSVPQYSGMTAYTTTFQGTWRYSVVDGVGRWAAGGSAPSWGANPPALDANGTARQYCPNGTMPATALRRVIVDGEELSFQRSVRRPV
ncbi:hypothetical protein Bequi_03145 [Brachybacterium sp. JHP9]|uniref:Cell wall protein n=1 Tax=Brachybacterium equifaecis TaxID=2910770 RepID=A0ABT0QYV0_9MICO|nr:hypothetical protein [Brachybacterium equifaecis]MCL6422388.1 hypothetical protein [Brachybacterium equifaecis]